MPIDFRPYTWPNQSICTTVIHIVFIVCGCNLANSINQSLICKKGGYTIPRHFLFVKFIISGDGSHVIEIVGYSVERLVKFSESVYCDFRHCIVFFDCLKIVYEKLWDDVIPRGTPNPSLSHVVDSFTFELKMKIIQSVYWCYDKLSLYKKF